MSYRCDKCNAIHEGTELNWVAKVRKVVYNRCFERFNRKENKTNSSFDSSSEGSEYVDVERLCAECYDNFKDVTPAISNEVKRVDFIGKRPAFKRESPNDGINIDGGELMEKYRKGD